MFAATQQIASVAGLKATKVQVRRFASQRSGDDFERFCPPPFFFEPNSMMNISRVVSFFERDILLPSVRGRDDGTKE